MLCNIPMKLNPLRNLLQTRGQHIATTSSLSKIYKIQSTEEFEEKVKNSKKPVVVDFFATWCNPCKMLTPRIETVIQEAGDIDLAKVDIDEHSDLALDYDVGSVPVLLVVRDGKVEKRLVGLQDTDKLKQWVQSAVK